MNEMKPCPFCRCRVVSLEDIKRQCFVECSKCGATGPVYDRDKKEKAVEAWNNTWMLWVHVTESLPEEGLNVLIIHDGIVDIGYQHNGEWYSNTPGHRFLDVEHWCYLPPLPEKSDDSPQT